MLHSHAMTYDFFINFATRRERRTNIGKTRNNTPRNQKMSKSCHQSLFHFTSCAPPSTTLHHLTTWLNYHQWQLLSIGDPTIQTCYSSLDVIVVLFFFCPYLGSKRIHVSIVNCNKRVQPQTTHFSPMFIDASNVNVKINFFSLRYLGFC